MSIVGVNPKKKNWNEQAIVNQAIACFAFGEKTYVKYDYENACHRSNDIGAYKDE